MKLYSYDTDEDPNADLPPIVDDDAQEDEEQYDVSSLFGAPSYADFIKTKPNSKAGYYEKRVASMMKAGLVGSLNAENWPDAATFLKHGPGFAKAAGNLAAEDARAARIVDMLTAPESPYVMFAMVAIPMVAQLFRNHQSDMAAAGATLKERRAAKKQEKLAGTRKLAPPITIRIFKREIKLPIRLRVRLPNFKNVFKAFLAPTEHPGKITQEVFSDPAVIKALHKMGLFPQEGRREDEAA